jgi:hypothetical protein
MSYKNNNKNIARLARICKKWGGKLIKIKDYSDFPIWDKNFEQAPFTTEDLAIIHKDKIIFYSDKIKWPQIIHEMGHVFACHTRPKNSSPNDEYMFFGWEYLLAKQIKGSIKDWFIENRKYSVGENTKIFINLGALSRNEKYDIINKRIKIAKNKKIIINNKSIPIR